MKPSYEPAAGTVAGNLTMTLLFWPAGSVSVAGETVTLEAAALSVCTAKLKPADAPVTLVIFSVMGRVVDSVVVVMAPKATVAGSRVAATFMASRSEERRVGKEGRSRWSPDH